MSFDFDDYQLFWVVKEAKRSVDCFNFRSSESSIITRFARIIVANFKTMDDNRTAIRNSPQLIADSTDGVCGYMRFWMVLCMLLLLSCLLFAQSGKVYFTGRVIDAEAHNPIEFGAVRLFSLPDSALLAGSVTRKDGKFTFSVRCPADKKLLLNISFIGYTSMSKTLPSPRSNLIEAGDIKLIPQGFSLDETIVVGQASMAATVEDTTVFNASAFRTPEGATLDKLVEQLPGAELTDDGKIVIQGKEVKKILVDGKEFFFDDPQAALKNLPVEMVEKLKAYERKSDLARLTGIDDGEEEMILDLSVKKNMKKGWMERFFVGAGGKGRYELGNTLNRFRDTSQFTLIANINNTNNQGFEELQQESSGATGNTRDKAGLVTSRSLGFNYSQDRGNVKLRSNAQYVGTNRTQNSLISIDNFLRKDRSLSRSANRNQAENHNLVANVYLEWKVDSLTTLVARPQLRYGKGDRNSGGEQRDWANDTVLNERISSGENNTSQYNAGLMLQWSRKLNRMGRNIALKMDYGINASSSFRQNFATTHYLKSDTVRINNQKIDNRGEGNNYRFQIVYVEPLPWLHFLQLRYSYQHRVNDSRRWVYDWDEMSEDFFSELDSTASNNFENQYANHLFNVSVRTNRKKYNYNIGIDLEPQQTISHSYIGQSAEYPLKRSVLNFSPTINFRYKYSKRRRLQLVYRGKSKQPSIRDMQPISDYTNPLNIRIGNPSLKPSYTNAFTLNYNSYQDKSQRNIVLFLLAENTLNSIATQVTYDSDTGVRTTMPVNMNGDWHAQATFTLNTPLGKHKKWWVRSYSNLQFSHKNGYTALKEQDSQRSIVKHFTGRERLKLTYRLPKVEIGAHAEVLYNNSYNNVSDHRTETSDYKFGGNVLCYLPWGFEFFSDCIYRLRVGYAIEEGRENLMWNLQLSQSFFKRKEVLLRLKVYDVLRQEDSLVRSISATAIRDTEYNVLGSYFMLHVIVRLNLMGI